MKQINLKKLLAEYPGKCHVLCHFMMPECHSLWIVI